MKLFLALGLPALLLSGFSAAAAPENELISGTTFSSDPALGLHQLHEFAECAANRYPKLVARWIDLPAKEAGAKVGEFTTNTFECTSGLVAVRTSPGFLRGGLVEALYLRATKRSSQADEIQVALHQLNFGSGDYHQLPLCVAQRDFAQADGFLRTYPATKGETAAFEAMTPAIRACATELKARIPARSTFRATLADVLYSAFSQIQPAGAKK
jgi:hypothetical protein